MTTKLCIFDLDGTLLDTLDDIADSMNSVMLAKGFPPRGIKWYMDNVGYGAKNLLEGALPPDHGLGDEAAGELLDAFKKHYLQHCMDKTKPYEGIPELLKYLEHAGIKMFVVTNKSHKTSVELIKTYFGDVGIAAVYGEQPGAPKKPDPSLAYEILSIAGVSPEEAVVIGDAETDIMFARNASIFSIGVSWGFRSRDVLEACGADVIIDSPGQIMEYL